MLVALASSACASFWSYRHLLPEPQPNPPASNAPTHKWYRYSGLFVLLKLKFSLRQVKAHALAAVCAAFSNPLFPLSELLSQPKS